MKNIHFVCRGNVYRSRMAEAYFNSLTQDNPELVADSSGIQAKLALNGDVDPVAVNHLKDDEILEFLAPMWRQTTQEMIDGSDLVVVMSDTLLEGANEFLSIPDEKLVLINIPDVDGVYEKVKNEVDKIISKLLS